MMRSFWKEVIGMCFYYSSKIGYFYAWNYVHARKRVSSGALYVVNMYGEKCPCGDKETIRNPE